MKGSATISYSNAPTYLEFAGQSGAAYGGAGPVYVEIARSATDSSIYTVSVGGHAGLPEFGGKITKVEVIANVNIAQYVNRFECEKDQHWFIKTLHEVTTGNVRP